MSRIVKSPNEFFDILDQIGNGKFVTIGYVTGANLNVPKVQRKNPLTNRMKGYPDYSVFGDEGEEIGSLVKVSAYNLRYEPRKVVGRKYGEYKQSASSIRGEYGLPPIGDKEGYKEASNWGENGPDLYKGKNEQLQGHVYNAQNVFGVKPKSVIYAVNKEGHVMKSLTPEQIVPYLNTKREPDGVAALRKMGAEEEKIKEFISRIDELKFKYMNFEGSSILWIAATVNGEKIVYINDNLQRAVDGINIDPQDFIAIAKRRYEAEIGSLNESTRSARNIDSIISEAINSVLQKRYGKFL
jgi:hypothetical protein